MLTYNPQPNEWWWASIGMPMFAAIATFVLGAASFIVALAAWRVSLAATKTAKEAHEASIAREARDARAEFAKAIHSYLKPNADTTIVDVRRIAAETGQGAPGIVDWYEIADRQIESLRVTYWAGAPEAEQIRAIQNMEGVQAAHIHLDQETRRRVDAWIPAAVFDALPFADRLFDA